MGRFIDATLRLIDDFTKPMSNAVSTFEQKSKSMMRAGKEIEKVGNGIASLGTKMTAAITVPVATMGAAAVQNFGNVDKKLKLVASTMGDAKWATGDLEGALKKAAANSVFTMNNAAEATLNFARQGFDAKKSAEMLEPTLSLAAGTATDLSEATSGLGNTLKVFESQGLTASKAADIFAQAQAQANTTTSELFQAMSVGSSIFKTVGWSMQDLATVTDVFGDNFISGSEGATAMKTGLARLVSPAKEGSIWIKKLGLNVTNADGTMQSMVKVQEQLHDAFAGLTQEEQMQAASAIFGKNQMGKWLTLINTAPETVQNYRNSLDDLNGTANGMADSLLSGVGGSIEKLKSTFDVFTYSIGSNLAGPAKKGIDKITEMIEAFNNMDAAAQKNILKYVGLAAAMGPGLTIMGKTISTVGGTVTSLGKLGKGLKDMGDRARVAKGILATLKMPKLVLPSGLGKLTSLFGSGAGKAFSLFGSGASKAAAPLKSLGGVITSFAGKSKLLQGTAKVGGGAFSILGKGIKAINSPFTKGAKVIGTAGKALFTLLGPAGTAIVVIAAIVAAGILLYKNWDKVVAAAKKLGAMIKSVFQSCGFDMQSFSSSAGSNLQKFIAKAQELWEFVEPVVKKIGQLWFTVFKVELAGIIGGAVGLFGSLLQSVTEIFAGLTRVFGGIVDFIVGVFTGDWEKAWTGVKDIFGGIFDMLVALAKAPINGVISLINGAIAGINNMGITIPDWVPKPLGGKSFKIDIPTIPMLYSGTNNWKGGPAMIHDRGAEIVDLPSGTRVYPHDKSIQMAKEEGQKKVTVLVQKIADKVVISDPNDVDKVMDRFIRRLEDVAANMA